LAGHGLVFAERVLLLLLLSFCRGSAGLVGRGYVLSGSGSGSLEV